MNIPNQPYTCYMFFFPELSKCHKFWRTRHLSPYSTKKRVCVGYSLLHLTHEMYMPNAKTQRQGPNATYIPLEMGFALATQCEEIYTQKIKHGRHKKFASANLKYTNMLVYFALGNAKYWRRVYCPTPIPDGRYF